MNRNGRKETPILNRKTWIVEFTDKDARGARRECLFFSQVV